jgi:phosphoribosylanthranilate isomerase
MSIFVKICGLNSAEAVDAAAKAGADAVGFVFAESPRRVSVDEAVKLTQRLPPHVMRVAVMRHPTQMQWAEVANGLSPDWLQTDAGDFGTLDIESGVTRLPVYRDHPAFDAGVVAREDRILFEAPTSGQGQQADWNRARDLATKTQLMLAGGLDPLNVESAILKVRPWGVDVSSGVERGRGRKDPERITAFIEAVRKTELTDAI